MTSFVEQQRIEDAARRWPGVDLDEHVPRSVAYREVYGKLDRWAAEQTVLAHAGARHRTHGTELSDEALEAGHRAAQRIAHDIFVRVGTTARAYLAALPDPPEQKPEAPLTTPLPPDDGPAPAIVTVSTTGGRL